MTPRDLPRVLELARAAQEEAPGPWKVEWADDRPDPEDHPRYRGIIDILDSEGEQVVVGDCGQYPPHGPVAEFIAAASPDVVIGLCQRVRELESGIKDFLESYYSHGGTSEYNYAMENAIGALYSMEGKP